MGISNQPDGVVRRLSRYYRYLNLLQKLGISRVSSNDLAEKVGNTPSQVRQDFSCFGTFGLQGYGYEVDALVTALETIMGFDTPQRMIIIGAGHLGQALASHTYFEEKRFTLTGIFDIKPGLIGKSIRGIEISHMNQLPAFVKNNGVDIAVLTVPKEKIYDTVDLLKSLGVIGIWNFSPVEPKGEEDLIVENVHLSDSLMTLSYRLKEKKLQAE